MKDFLEKHEQKKQCFVTEAQSFYPTLFSSSRIFFLIFDWEHSIQIEPRSRAGPTTSPVSSFPSRRKREIFRGNLLRAGSNSGKIQHLRSHKTG